IEDEDQSRLARLHQCWNLLPVMDDIDERGLWRQIGIPKVVMYALEKPFEFAGRSIQRNQGIAEQVRARTIAAVAIVARRAERHQQSSRLCVQCESAPNIHARAVFPAII